MYKSEFLQEIHSRGFIYQSSDIDKLDVLMNNNVVTGYIGFDPTNDSLHVGSLVQLMLLHWMQHYGHHPIALMGGGTTLIGDPSGKDESRKIIQKEQVESNIKQIDEMGYSKTYNINNLLKEQILNNIFSCKDLDLKKINSSNHWLELLIPFPALPLLKVI